MAEQEFKRVQMKIPVQIVEQWDEWADQLGISRTAFVTMAAAMGGRAIMRQLAPEKFITPDLVKAFRDAGFYPDASIGEVDGL
jgi:hypothetical protein